MGEEAVKIMWVQLVRVSWQEWKSKNELMVGVRMCVRVLARAYARDWRMLDVVIDGTLERFEGRA